MISLSYPNPDIYNKETKIIKTCPLEYNFILSIMNKMSDYYEELWPIVFVSV